MTGYNYYQSGLLHNKAYERAVNANRDIVPWMRYIFIIGTFNKVRLTVRIEKRCPLEILGKALYRCMLGPDHVLLPQYMFWDCLLLVCCTGPFQGRLTYVIACRVSGNTCTSSYGIRHSVESWCRQSEWSCHKHYLEYRRLRKHRPIGSTTRLDVPVVARYSPHVHVNLITSV